MPRTPDPFDRSPDPLAWVDEAVERYEAEKREWWANEEAKKYAMEAAQAEQTEPAEKAQKVQVGAKRKASEMDDELTDEYTCPITHELPVEPCIAEDGHLYDQWALEKWMESQTELRSPMTNKPMGKKVYPAVQARNAIHRLIDKGLIAGEGAKKWKTKQKELESMDASMRVTVGKAFKGDVPSMRKFAFAYRDGRQGVAKDVKSAVHWFRLAARADDAISLACIAFFYLNGLGLPKDEATAMVYMTRAAMCGSEHACVSLGRFYATGDIVRFVNVEQATYWYTRSLRCDAKDSNETARGRRDAWFKEHGGGA